MVYKAGSCPDLILDDGEGKHWLSWNPPYFSPDEYGGQGTMDRLIASPEPYVLSARSFLELLADTRRSPFDSSQPVTLPLAVHYWEGSTGELEFLVGNPERALPGDSEIPKTLDLTLPRDWLQSAGKQLNVTELTGGQVLSTSPGAGGGCKIQLPAGPNGSNVWASYGK